ncbi:MAG: AAA family ATPase, partial [Proteobacteria bacterium]|nr:AAA family ATPase [Pseudomonadota bacterium]
VHLPPLRQRSGDLPTLVRAFLERAGAGPLAASMQGVAEREVLARLTRYHWPGNVRELRNVIARAVALAGPDDDFASLPFAFRPTAPAPATETFVADKPFHDAKDALVARFEREYLTDLVARAHGNLSEAARIAGLERKFLYKLLERAGLRGGVAPGSEP